jgi:DNA modification methylase
MKHVLHCDALAFAKAAPDNCIDLILIDPPYYGIVDDSWDNQWKNEAEYVDWLVEIICTFQPSLKPTASLLMFGAIGKHGSHPFWEVCKRLEAFGWCYRNIITLKKRRAYGKSHDYLFCREDIAWFSASHERTELTFNIPLLNEKRGYAGFNAKYPAKSEFKRVSNVWTDDFGDSAIEFDSVLERG